MAEIEPQRIQLSRKKGWRMPENTVSVARPTKWGNPFTPFGCMEAGFVGTVETIHNTGAEAFRVWLTSPYWRNNWDGPESEAARARMLAEIGELKGKNLACWCKPGDPCHGDVLLSLARARLMEGEGE